MRVKEELVYVFLFNRRIFFRVVFPRMVSMELWRAGSILRNPGTQNPRKRECTALFLRKSSLSLAIEMTGDHVDVEQGIQIHEQVKGPTVD